MPFFPTVITQEWLATCIYTINSFAINWLPIIPTCSFMSSISTFLFFHTSFHLFFHLTIYHFIDNHSFFFSSNYHCLNLSFFFTFSINSCTFSVFFTFPNTITATLIPTLSTQTIFCLFHPRFGCYASLLKYFHPIFKVWASAYTSFLLFCTCNLIHITL